MIASRNTGQPAPEGLAAPAPPRTPPAPARPPAASAPSRPPEPPTPDVAPIEEIIDPHPLIKRTRKGVSKEKVREDRLLYLASADRLDLRVSKQALPRALWIFDALLKAAAAHDIHAAQVNHESKWWTVMVVYGESIPVSLREKVKSVERPRPANADSWYCTQYDYFPTGRLTFEIDSYSTPRRQWNEGSRQRLEKCFDSIIDALLATGEHLRDARLRREAEEQIARYEWRCKYERERREKEEKERIDALVDDAENWRRSATIRAYLVEFKACMEKWSGAIQPKTDVGRWLAWAETYADRLDPLGRRRW